MVSPAEAGLMPFDYLNRSQRLNVAFLYTLLSAAFLGFLTQPMPFFPYPGIRAFFACLFHLAVVRALNERRGLGFACRISSVASILV